MNLRSFDEIMNISVGLLDLVYLLDRMAPMMLIITPYLLYSILNKQETDSGNK